MSEDCPVDILTISGDRTPSGYSTEKQQKSNKTDQWETNEGDLKTPDSWTGITMFYLRRGSRESSKSGCYVLNRRTMSGMRDFSHKS